MTVPETLSESGEDRCSMYRENQRHPNWRNIANMLSRINKRNCLRFVGEFESEKVQNLLPKYEARVAANIAIALAINGVSFSGPAPPQ